jgi:hypothetical protein
MAAHDPAAKPPGPPDDPLPVTRDQRPEPPTLTTVANQTAPPLPAKVIIFAGAEPVPGYVLVERLGRGGFGEVWKARGPGDLHVALKFIPLQGRAGASEQRSLEYMRDIRHAHLVAVFGFWRREDYLVIAMELGDQTVKDRLDEALKIGGTGIPPEELAEFMVEAAKGVDYLNGLGIQHRDLKPQNLLLVGGCVKVADFGLAKLLEHSVESNSGAMTPAYVAPEFLRGTTSAHSDQYALAVSYCELRGGRLPFQGTAAQMMAGHLMLPPDLSMLPEGERAAVARALAKEPEGRWPNCRGFVEALELRLNGSSPGLARRPEKPDSDKAEGGVRTAAGAYPAGSPVPPTEEVSEHYRGLDQAAATASANGDMVRAAITYTSAARFATPVQAAASRDLASRELQRLVNRLGQTVHLAPNSAGDWVAELTLLLGRADQGAMPAEAAILFELQKACREHESESYAFDMARPILSQGRTPLQRALPCLRDVRVARHVRAALRRLAGARLTDMERTRLRRLLVEAVRGADDRVRQSFGSVLSRALLEAGVRSTSAEARQAIERLTGELLCRITARGYFTFVNLRHAITRNGLRIPDFGDPQEFLRDDPLWRLDRLLAEALDGVYRPADAYRRWAQRSTSLVFGTSVGRVLWRYAAMPFGGAFVLIEMLDYLLGRFTPAGSLSELARTVSGLPEVTGGLPFHLVVHGTLTLLIGGFLFALSVFGAFRRVCYRSAAALGRGTRLLVLDLPSQALRMEIPGNHQRSWAVQLGYAFLIKPLVLWSLLALCWPVLLTSVVRMTVGIVLTGLLVNSRPGMALERAALRGLSWLHAALTGTRMSRLIRWVAALLKGDLGLADGVTRAVDECLRPRSGDDRSSRVSMAIAALLWAPIGWLARFYVAVLIEPGFNPVKAPLSIVAAKFVYPWVLNAGLHEQMANLLGGGRLGWLFTLVTIWLLPDAIAFLLWETKENWELYREKDPALIESASDGRGNGDALPSYTTLTQPQQ